MRADRAKALDQRDPPARPGGQGRPPSGALRHRVQHRQMPAPGGQMRAAEPIGILPRQMRQLVDEALVVEPVLRRIDRSPIGIDLVRDVLVMPPRHRRHHIGEHHLGLGIGQLHVIGLPRRDAAIRAQCRLQLRRGLRAIGALLHVFLARPDDLHRMIDLHRHPCDLLDDLGIGREPPPEPATHDHRMEGHIRHRQSGELGQQVARLQRVLRRAPHLQLAVVVVPGHGEGLHRRLVQERHAVIGVQTPPPRRGQSGGHIAAAICVIGLALPDQRGLRGMDRLAGEAPMAAIAELRRQGAHALQRRPIAAGHHHHRVVEPNDLFHPLDRQCRRRIDPQQLAAAHRRGHHRRHPHPRQGEIDAILGAAIDLGGNVEAIDRLADQAIVGAGFQHRFARQAAPRRRLGQFAIAQAAPGRRMGHAAGRCGQFARRHAQPIGGGGDQRQPRRRPHHTHAELPGGADRRRAAGDLDRRIARQRREHHIGQMPDQIGMARHARDEHLGQRRVAKGIVRRRLLDAHVAPVGVQLVGQHLRQRGVRSLPEIDVR